MEVTNRTRSTPALHSTALHCTPTHPTPPHSTPLTFKLVMCHLYCHFNVMCNLCVCCDTTPIPLSLPSATTHYALPLPTITTHYPLSTIHYLCHLICPSHYPSCPPVTPHLSLSLSHTHTHTQIGAGTAFSQIDCTALTTCEEQVQYEAVAPTKTSQRQCLNLKVTSR